MGKYRSITILSGVIVTAIAVLAPSAAFGAVDPSTPPPAVTGALQPGSATFNDVLTLGATDSAGKVSQSSRVAATSVSFGTPHAYYYYAASDSTSKTFTEADFATQRGRTWLAVEYVGGKPTSMVEVDDGGAFVALGGWPTDLLPVINALPAKALVVTDGRYDETYTVTEDLGTITALNAGARSLVGGTSTDAQTFRDAKAAQDATTLAALEDEGFGPDSVGGMPGGTEPGGASDVGAVIAEVTVGAALLIVGGYLLGRRHHRPHPATTTADSSTASA